MKSHVLLLLTSLGFMSFFTYAEAKFFDGFESGDLNSTSADGFAWSGSGKYSENNWPVTGKAKEGNYSLLFRYPAGQNWVERRFILATVYPEIWISFWIKVPSNFKYVSDITANNAKLFSLWTYQYTDTTQPKATWNWWRTHGSTDESGAIHSTITITGATNMGRGHQGHFYNFIRWPEDRGRWMHLVAHYKLADPPGTETGVFEWWRRWENESEYTRMWGRSDIGWTPDEIYPQGFSAGYLMGYANQAYAEDTSFFIDNFTVSTKNPSNNTTELIPPILRVFSE